jgi:RNA polymerase-binding transcription factor DksA
MRGQKPHIKFVSAQLISDSAVPLYFMAVRRTKRAFRRRPAAATADVIGSNLPPNEHVPDKWKKHYRHLIQLRNYLLNRQGELVKDAAEERPAFSFHMADAGTDSFDRDFALSRVSSEQDALYEIEDALMRIRRGTYGICELTGKPIERERLEAIPWARFSAAAEKQLEKDGAIRRTHLGPREPVTRTTSEDNEPESFTDEDRF